jgi:hypothetical protein
MNMDDVVLLKTAARAVHGGDRGSLEQQLGGLFTAPTSLEALPRMVVSMSST